MAQWAQPTTYCVCVGLTKQLLFSFFRCTCRHRCLLPHLCDNHLCMMPHRCCPSADHAAIIPGPWGTRCRYIPPVGAFAPDATATASASFTAFCFSFSSFSLVALAPPATWAAAAASDAANGRMLQVTRAGAVDHLRRAHRLEQPGPSTGPARAHHHREQAHLGVALRHARRHLEAAGGGRGEGAGLSLPQPTTHLSLLELHAACPSSVARSLSGWLRWSHSRGECGPNRPREQQPRLVRRVLARTPTVSQNVEAAMTWTPLAFAVNLKSDSAAISCRSPRITAWPWGMP